MKKLSMAELIAKRLPVMGLTTAQATYMYSCLKVPELQAIINANDICRNDVNGHDYHEGYCTFCGHKISETKVKELNFETS